MVDISNSAIAGSELIAILQLWLDSGPRSRQADQGIMASGKFDGEAFFAAIDGVRITRDLTWKKVAEQSGVPASSLTRMSQGRRPDVDSFAALCAWSGLKADQFTGGTTKSKEAREPLAELTAHLRADPNLSKEGAKALEALIKAAYQQFRKR
ncbi:helix-turn-helix domain-containing protein [Bradyrhizobium sp. BR 1433]|uniref:helix-turn-helix domain-containing protein n=1 Tax=Bradyrhizobium sp. BR 1433 TaxID=3447967 RepID=UPI003EE7E623